jgi:uncharacterized protein
VKEPRFSSEERLQLLSLARRSIELSVNGQRLPELTLSDYPPILREAGASFVTLSEEGELRGCIGVLEAFQPLVQDVCEHAAAAALEDYRFFPVQANEVDKLKIEISVLSPPVLIEYKNPEDLVNYLQPGVDGVLIRDGRNRATFLPQVWEKIPAPDEFLTYLCQKMGAPGQLWKTKKLQVYKYQVEEFQENESKDVEIK